MALHDFRHPAVFAFVCIDDNYLAPVASIPSSTPVLKHRCSSRSIHCTASANRQGTTTRAHCAAHRVPKAMPGFTKALSSSCPAYHTAPNERLPLTSRTSCSHDSTAPTSLNAPRTLQRILLGILVALSVALGFSVIATVYEADQLWYLVSIRAPRSMGFGPRNRNRLGPLGSQSESQSTVFRLPKGPKDTNGNNGGDDLWVYASSGCCPLYTCLVLSGRVCTAYLRSKRGPSRCASSLASEGVHAVEAQTFKHWCKASGVLKVHPP